MDNEQTSPPRFVWGAANIGKVIGCTERQVYHMITTGQLPARKLGRKHVAEYGALVRHIAGSTDGRAA